MKKWVVVLIHASVLLLTITVALTGIYVGLYALLEAEDLFISALGFTVGLSFIAVFVISTFLLPIVEPSHEHKETTESLKATIRALEYEIEKEREKCGKK